MQQQGDDTRFAPIPQPESNPSERCMRELSKFCRIYSNENHRKWDELLLHIENWKNNSVCNSTGYTPSEFMYGTERSNVFRYMLPKETDPDQEEGGIERKFRRAYQKMKKGAVARKKLHKRGNAEWKPELNEKVLVKIQQISNAVRGINSKCLRPFQGSYWISKVLGHSACDLRDEQVKVRGEFNKKHL